MNNRQGLGIYSLTIILAMLLRVAPWPQSVLNMNPDWILLTLIYWSLITPDRSGVISAWLVGLLTDVLTGRLLGQYALSYALSTYLCIKLNKRLRHFPFLQQALFIFSILFMSQMLIFWTEKLQGTSILESSFWFPVLTGTLLWPLVNLMLHRISRIGRVG